MTENEAREGMGGDTSFQVGEVNHTPIQVGENTGETLFDRNVEHLENLLIAQGE